MARDDDDDNGTSLTDASPNPNWFLRARLKTRQLLLLIALDDERNIHRAAEVLCMTQPAASKQLKDLEDMLDVKLFELGPGANAVSRAWASRPWLNRGRAPPTSPRAAAAARRATSDAPRA